MATSSEYEAGGVLVIAEAGVNHDGDPATADALVVAAAAAGADCIKFQTFSADRLTTRSAPKAAYQSVHDSGDESQHAMLSRLALSRDSHELLMTRARDLGIEFLSTGFDAEDVDFLVGLGVQRIKIPSGEITNLPLLRHVGATGLPVLLSTGMSDLDEVTDAVQALEMAGTPRDRITVLHCTTQYPTPVEDVNLRAMSTIAERLDVRVGYSDHTLGHEVAIAAVARGATVIEKHLTLNRAAAGPDHASSLDPAQFTDLVRAVRTVERALGDGRKLPRPGELANRAIARRSLVTTAPIRAGEQFSRLNTAAKRPGTGISPMAWDTVIGRTATRDYLADELIDP